MLAKKPEKSGNSVKNLGISVDHLFRSGKFKEHLKYGLFNLVRVMKNGNYYLFCTKLLQSFRMEAFCSEKDNNFKKKSSN